MSLPKVVPEIKWQEEDSGALLGPSTGLQFLVHLGEKH